MSEATAETSTKKTKTEVTTVEMEDGRKVGFAGNRRIDKSIVIDDSKVSVDGDGTVMLQPGAVRVRIDFRNGKSILHTPNPILVPQYIGHGGSQKLGDEAANEKDVDDAFLAIEDLHQRLEGGDWKVQGEAGAFSGASDVAKAVVEAQNNTLTLREAQDWLNAKFTAFSAAAEAQGEKYSRKKFYDAFRNPKSKTGVILERMAKEKLVQAASFDADAEIAAMTGGAA